YLGSVILFLLFLLTSPGFSFLECTDSTHHMVGLSGVPLCLRPSIIQTEIHSVKWKMKLLSLPGIYVILTWKNSTGLKYEALALKHFNKTLDFQIEDLTLLIKVAKPEDSGHYQLEVTKESGEVFTVQFKVFVFDHVEQPLLQGQWKALDERKCQVTLYCLVSRDSNVSYTWYRSNELIPTLRNITYLELQIDANDLHIYSCNVSNPVSWASHTLNLSQGCLHVLLRPRFLTFLVIVMILVTLFLVTLICFCVWKRKRKQSQTSPQALLTIYEDVIDPQMRRNEHALWRMAIQSRETKRNGHLSFQSYPPPSPISFLHQFPSSDHRGKWGRRRDSTV
uniref:Ig-like domain-containing protein n=1 Tax=Sciurus vulgaris TaxID=55149 RepID=A0A8D2BBQ5_SCIVU